MSVRDQLDLAIRQIEFARHYTLSLLKDIRDDEWSRVPDGATTHAAWQVGHLAMAEYGLCLFRQRGRLPVDTELMSSKFRKQFSKGTRPEVDPSNLPSPADIRGVLEQVHAQVLTEAPEFSEEGLMEAIDEPYAVFDTRLGALLFCSHHEMLHAGQIGLLRRLLGKDPIR